MERSRLAKLVSLGEAWETKKPEIDQSNDGTDFTKKEYEEFLESN